MATALLLGFAAMYLFSVHDRAPRSFLETVTEPRAVGDNRFFPLPEKPTTDQPLAKFGKRELRAAQTGLVKERDSRMEKVGFDETVSFYIYRATDPVNREFYFLKVANEKYLKCISK